MSFFLSIEKGLPVLLISQENLDCGIRINEPSVSAAHFYLERRPDNTVYLHNTSKNGTILNKKLKLLQKENHILKDGDRIYIRKKKKDEHLSLLYKEIQKDSPDRLEETLLIRNDEFVEQETDNESLWSGDLSGEPDHKKMKIEEKNECESLSNSEKKPQSSNMKSKSLNLDENLKCSICYEIWHQAVTLQPCLHTFCGGCCSPWVKENLRCPTCRKDVEVMSKNHLLNNMAESYLQANPSLKRSESDIKQVEAKNEVHNETVRVKELQQHSCGSSSSFSSPSSQLFIFSIPVQPALPTQCRSCPGYSNNSGGASIPPFTCDRNNPEHILCNCCFQPMPVRQINCSVPPQRCVICDKAYCSLYWGCRGGSCSGCLNLLAEHAFTDSIYSKLILNNDYESIAFKQYLDREEMTWAELMDDCLSWLDDNSWSMDPPSFGVGPRGFRESLSLSHISPVCNACAEGVLKQHAYTVRSNLSPSDLPAQLLGRPDCYWGKECRTQKTNASHARRYNHVCERTRFT